MRLVKRAEFVHQALVEFRVVERIAAACDAEAEISGIAEILFCKLIVATKRLILLFDRKGAALRIGMHEADAGVARAAQLFVVVLDNAAEDTEVENAGDAMDEMIERAM